MRVLGALVFVLSLSSASAVAEPYISVFGGTGFSTLNSESVEFITEVGVGAGDTEEFLFTEKRKFSAGIIAGGAIGYEFNLPVPGRARVELEGSYRRNQEGILGEFPACSRMLFDSVCLIGGAESLQEDFRFEKITSTSGMLNFVYVSPSIAGMVSVYAGGGVGASHIDFQFRSFQGVELFDAIFIGFIEDVRWELTAFQWQAMAGFSAEVMPQFELFVEGRFSRAAKSDSGNLSSGGAFDTRLAFPYAGVLAGVRFKFK